MDDIIYVIKCAGCIKQYIGETGNLRDRLRVQRQQMFTPHLCNLCVSHYITQLDMKHHSQ